MNREKEGFDSGSERRSVDTKCGWSGAAEFAVGIVDAEEPPGLTYSRPVRDELRKRRSGKVAYKAVGLQFPTCPPLESHAGEPMNKVGASIIDEEFGCFRHDSLSIWAVGSKVTGGGADVSDARHA
jgi:hypothetical protein